MNTSSYTLTLGDTTQGARSLAYAQALAPQMLLRMGTQHMFSTIQVRDTAGRVVAQFNQKKGWVVI